MLLKSRAPALKLAVSLSLAVSLTGCGLISDAQSPNSATQSKTNFQPDRWPQIQSAIVTDPTIEHRVKTLLNEMTLEQKVAQVIQPEIRSITVEDMRKYGFGSYLNGGGAYPDDNKHATPADWVKLAEAMYQASIDDSLDGSRIPTMWGTDAVHGHNNVIGATLFPHNIGLGAARNPELIEAIAQATAKEVLATGIDWIFAPTVATAQDDRWGRTYESYSESPDVVRDYAAAIVKGLQGSSEQGFFQDHHVISTVKHFIGDGGTVKGDDQGDNISSEADLIKYHAQGYVGGLTAGAQTVMASFNSWHGNKIHGDQYLLTDVLKNRMGFDGLVVGDWNGHGQIPGCSNGNCPQAMNAGLDIYMTPNPDWKDLYHNLIKQVQNGTIEQSRLDDAVTRILRVKVRAGLFDKPSPANRKYAGNTEFIGSAEHRAIARQAVRESLVLLKNNHNILPLDPYQHVLIAGDAADNIGKQSGGWTITWQGTGNENSDFPGATSIYSGLKQKIEANGGSVTLSENGEFTRKPDAAIVVFGEEPYAEGNGDIDNLEYQRGNKRDLQLLKKLKALDIPVISVFISGRPMWVNPELNASDAFVAAWLPGSEGQGIADVIIANSNGTASYPFTGKLPFSWPATPFQIPNKQNKTRDNAPLFPYGYGLNYTTTTAFIAQLDESSNAQTSASLDQRELFVGTVKKPWHVAGGLVNQLQPMQSSVLQNEGVDIQTMDRRIQEDSLNIQWHGKQLAEFGLYSPFPDDLLSYQEANASLQFDYQLHSATAGDMQLKIQCLAPHNCNNSIAIAEALQQHAQPGTWSTMSVALSCFANQQVTFNKVMSPFILSNSQPVQMAISDVKLVPNTGQNAVVQCQ